MLSLNIMKAIDKLVDSDEFFKYASAPVQYAKRGEIEKSQLTQSTKHRQFHHSL